MDDRKIRLLGIPVDYFGYFDLTIPVIHPSDFVVGDSDTVTGGQTRYLKPTVDLLYSTEASRYARIA